MRIGTGGLIVKRFRRCGDRPAALAGLRRRSAGIGPRRVASFSRCVAQGTAAALALILAFTPLHDARAQPAAAIEEVVVTGSRIRRDPLNERAPVTVLGREQLERTGLTNLGHALQSLPLTGSAPNSQFNVPGNSGFPQDGAGIGAGTVQVSLRNVQAKRTLVPVDGRRWVAGASASGVPAHVDLNTIPDNVIERVEILQDGASAIYGSDAIGGVVNIITDRAFSGLRLGLQTGGYLGEGDGESTEAGLKWGARNGTTHLVLSASYRDERGIETAARARSAFPNPNAGSCDVPGTLCSSFTPQGRFVYGPNHADGASVTLNDGVLNDGRENIPAFDPANPYSGDFHAFTAADRCNYNGPGFNYLRTPNERTNLFASARHGLGAVTELFATLSYTNRTSATKAAPDRFAWGRAAAAASPTGSSFPHTIRTTPSASTFRRPRGRWPSSAAARWNPDPGCSTRTSTRTSARWASRANGRCATAPCTGRPTGATARIRAFRRNTTPTTPPGYWWRWATRPFAPPRPAACRSISSADRGRTEPVRSPGKCSTSSPLRSGITATRRSAMQPST